MAQFSDRWNPLCSNKECRAVPKRYAPPLFFRHPPLAQSDRTTIAQPTAALSSRPCLIHMRALSPPQRGTEHWRAAQPPAPCVPLTHGYEGMPLFLPARMWCGESGAPIQAWTGRDARTGAVGGAARMRAGTPAARHAPLPLFACRVHAGMPHSPCPPTLMPVRWGRAESKGNIETGGAQVERRPSRTLCEHDPACVSCARPLRAPPFACHALVGPHAGRRAQGGMRKVGHAGSYSHPFPAVLPPPTSVYARASRLLRLHHPQPPPRHPHVPPDSS